MRERTLAKMPGKYRRVLTASNILQIGLLPLVLAALSLGPGSFFGDRTDIQNPNEGQTSACRERDSVALVALYNATDGPNWTHGWKLNEPLDTWWGVTLNSEGCVVCLDMDGMSDCQVTFHGGNNLVGVIPTELAALNSLEKLILTDNRISGEIPKVIGEITNLQTIFLTNNLISGTIPKELGNLINLEILGLDDNMLKGIIPKEIGNLSNLRGLRISENQLEGNLPNEISLLKNLTFFFGHDNNLSGEIPKEIGNLINLDNLILSNNKLSGELPIEIGELKKLKILLLAHNRISGSIPNEIYQLQQLEILQLNHNEFHGSIPPEIGNLEKLTDLTLSNNHLDGVIPPTLGDLNSLISLRLHHNNFTGSLPKSLGNLANLTNIFVHNNLLVGCFPEEYRRFCNIHFYDFSNNPGLPWNGDFSRFCADEDQTGTSCDDGDPNTLNDMIREDCDCRGEMISCRERDSLALVALYKATDGPNWKNTWILNEAIDRWWGVSLNEAGCVVSLYLSDNNLIGSIAPELGQIENLEGLYLLNNQLSGSIPGDLGQLSRCKDLFLGGNQLSGNIPGALGQLVNLEGLLLDDNLLSGQIPMEFGMLSKIEGLFLHRNQLTGRIPVELAQLNNLGILHLGFNQLNGSIPPELGQLTKLEQLNLQSNQLTGPIPFSIGHLSNLRFIDISGNQLTGEIPRELGLLDSCFFFSASGNQLVNCFPDLSNFCTIEERLTERFGWHWVFNQVDFSNNPGLPWSGDFSRFCAGEEQNGAPCDDGDPNTLNDIIRDCECRGEMTTCRERDSLALIALYNATNGPNWTITWSPEDAISTWHGVSLNDEGCVVVLDLHDNNLVGSIAPELGQMENLKGLYLYNNQLTASIPMEIGMLSKLEGLALYNNQLTGPIPPELGQLSNLLKLELNGNQLSGSIPVELSQLSKLKLLHLMHNQLSGTIPPQLSNLSMLEQFYVHVNQLTGSIPGELGQLKNLRALAMQGNQLTGNIPASLGNLSELGHLALYANQLSGSIPSTLGNLRRLQSVYFDNNNLTGEIPWELGLLDSCYVFLAANNQLSGCFPDLTNFCTIKERLADHFGGLGDFNRVDFSNNPGLPWSGDFSRICAGEEQNGAPCDDGDPNTLNDIIRDCECRGEMTTCRERDSLALIALYNATNGPNWTNPWVLNEPMTDWHGVELNEYGCVVELGLNDNLEMKGSIPPEISQLSNLRKLHLYQNALSGPIPTEIGNLSQLEELILQGNQLTGLIPTSLGQLDKLTHLELRVNRLSGNIPEELGNLIHLKTLSLGSNLLTGTIPLELLSLTELTFLGLNINQLTGIIPPGLSQLSNLKYLSLADNLLTGEIPMEISQLTRLEQLNLHGNQLTGFILSELGRLVNLRELTLHANQLRGEIPVELGLLYQLISLNLSFNQLSGEIPAVLGSLNNLRYLEIHSNQLTGSIPPELGQLQNLYVLQLYHNQLSGNIPSEIGLLDSCFLFLAFGNQLSGCLPDMSNFCTIEERLSNKLSWHVGFNLVDFSNNSGLPWGGDFSRYCAGEDQTGAFCDDGDPNTLNDIIRDCECRGEITTCRERDSLVLVALYNATNGPNWTNPWNLSEPMTMWYGLTLDQNGCVSDLRLCEDCVCWPCDGNNLQGYLPSDLGNLRELKTLAIVNNPGLTSRIPREVKDLDSLRFFSLELNSISESIPPEIGQMTNLRDLRLGGNQISGPIPAEIVNARNLHFFWADDNEIDGKIPSSIAELDLHYLGLAGNNLTGNIPIEFGNLINLRSLALNQNQLSGEIPPVLGNLERLNYLRLHTNQLSGNIPTELGNLDSCFVIQLQNNQLEGCFPNFTNFCTIEDRLFNHFGSEYEFSIVNFSNNPGLPWSGDFSRICAGEEQNGAPCDDGDPNTLNDIIRDCECRGEMTTCRERDSLALVALYNATDGPNWINSWDLDSAMENWWGVTLNNDGCVLCLDLDGEANCSSSNPLGEGKGNGLNGSIPEEIGDLSNLIFLSLAYNNLQSKIPVSITRILNLQELNLSNNQITGELPNQIGVMKNLVWLNLNSNQITGNIPTSFGDLENLIGCVLSNNYINGILPNSLGNLRQLAGLEIINNEINGVIPPEISGMASLLRLYLSNNQLIGPIPPQLSQLAKLEYLYLDGNKLSGTIPSELGHLNNLIAMSFYGNDLSGCYPSSLLNHCDIIYDFSNNPGLPWQGDFSRYCSGEDQMGAFCDDGDPNTQNTTIQDCSCKEDLCPMGILEPIDIRIHKDCNDPTGNEITVQFGTSLRKVGWWSSAGGNGSTVSFDVSENSTHAYHLRNDRYWVFVESEDGCSDTLPPFDLREDGSIRSIDLVDDNFISEKGEIEIDVLANDRVSVSGLNISLLDANYPTKIQHLGNGVFLASVPPSDEGVLTATYRVCDNECRMICDTAAIFIEFKGHCGDPGNYRLPNVITPFDGNGQNDELKLIYNVECPVFIEQISVINRWGDVVWKSTGPNEFWRGLNDRGEALPEGTYYYQVRLSIQGEGVPVMKTGHVTLLR